MRKAVTVLLLSLLAGPAVAQTDWSAMMDDWRMQQTMRELMQAGKQRGPDATPNDPGRAEREKAWNDRCKPTLVAAANGMQRYVYAQPDCEGRPLN
ncbi:MAG: hypothetical protein IT537_04785 [Hyphomicrobiales bacterium]|nr:hypothetical protein [Hyphomicrobiales bacterium]